MTCSRSGFADVATTIGRDESSCRQLARRARQHLLEARPRYDLPEAHGMQIVEAFHAASRQGDLTALRSLLTEDIAIHSDGGGKRPAALIPVLGIERAMLLFTRLVQLWRAAPAPAPRFCRIDGLPGYVTVEPDGLVQTTAFAIEGDRIAAIYIVRNPDKLRHLDVPDAGPEPPAGPMH